MVKVAVLGSTGMLGSAVGKYLLQQGFDVATSYRNEEVSYGDKKFFYDPTTHQGSIPDDCEYIINCIGVIKPFINDNHENSGYLNSLFPRQLAKVCKSRGVKLIHITTDCVFSGKDGGYIESDEHDCLDFYGKTKSLGEPKEDCMVIRTSIIGEEIHKDASLISWVKSMKGKTINGFTNHTWNGVTTKQYAKVCEKIIKEDLYKEGLYHVCSNSVTKHELVSIINERFDLEIDIVPTEAAQEVDRTLATNEDLSLLIMRDIPTVEEQIKDL